MDDDAAFDLTAENAVTGDDWAIRPNALTVKNNTRLSVTATNADALPNTSHNWYLTGYAGTGFLGSGESDTVVIELRTVGTFDFFCQVGGHRGNGMTGTLTVGE